MVILHSKRVINSDESSTKRVKNSDDSSSKRVKNSDYSSSKRVKIVMTVVAKGLKTVMTVVPRGVPVERVHLRDVEVYAGIPEKRVSPQGQKTLQQNSESKKG